MTNDTLTIEVPVEEDGLTYVWRGEDAETRHEQWALTGDATYDSADPLG